nr:class I SAM-dependent methyltransferase [Pantoea sp. Aalb]
MTNRWNLEQNIQSTFSLVMISKYLKLIKYNKSSVISVFVDFVSGSLDYRRRFGGGRSEALAKAVGIKGNYFPSVLDVTAGLGRDSFLLASLGCRVHMLERHPVIAALLYDGLERGYSDPEIGKWLRERLTMCHCISQNVLIKMKFAPDVIYLDPMYPHSRKKKATVKKEMQVIQELVGLDEDADELIKYAFCLAKKRIVVKRPLYAPPLGGILAQYKITTKKHRFDIYRPLIY